MAERTITITNAEYGYRIEEYDDASKTLIVCDADGEELEFDCEDGNIFISGSYDEEEPMRMTLPVCLEATKEFFIDWNIEDEVADSIIADLTDWFAEYCISEEEAIQDEIKELTERIGNRKEDIEMYRRSLADCQKEERKIQKRIADYIECIESMHMAIGSMQAEIYKLNEQLKGGK